jgi:PAS domain S-box-containing protein
MPIPQTPSLQTTPTATELSLLIHGLTVPKTASQYLQQACKVLTKALSVPVTAFITSPGGGPNFIAEQSLPVSLKGLLDYSQIKPTESRSSTWISSVMQAQITKQLGTTSVIYTSLDWRDEHIGGLIIWAKPASTLDIEVFFSGLAAQIATNLKTLLLEQSTQISLAEAATLEKITQAIAGSLDFDKVSKTLLHQALKFFHVDAITLSQISADGHEYVVTQSVGLSPEYINRLHVPRDAPLIKRLIKAHEPIQLDKLETAPITGDTKLAISEGVRSSLVIPIFSDGRLVCSLGLISKTPRTFTPAEQHFAESLGEHVGIAFANTNLHASLRRASNEIEQTRNLMRDGLLVFDIEHRMHYFNAAAGSVLGLKPEDLMKRFPGKNLKAISELTIDSAAVAEALSKALKGQVGRTQFSLDTTSQGTQYYEAICSPYRDTKGARIGALMNIRDITSLFLEKEKLQAIQSGISDGLILVGEDGATLECNDEWLRLFSISGDLVGQSFFELLSTRSNFSCDHDPLDVIKSVLRGKRITCYAHDLEKGRHVQISANPIANGGRITGAVATARDITPLIEKTVESNEMAAKAHRHLRELSQLAELSGIVGFNVVSIYQKYLSKTVTLLDSSSVSLYLYSPAKQLLIQDQTTNPAPSDTQTIELGSNHLAARAFTSRQPVTIVGEDRSLHRIAIPITHHSKTLGVLLVSRGGNAYGEHEAKLLRMVATRLAVLVENASLYHDVNARRERWEAVFRFTDEGIVIFDRSGTIVGFNPACTQITQYHPAEAIGKAFGKIIRGVGPSTISGPNVGPIERVLNEGVTIAKSEQLIENRGGSRVWTEISYSPIFDDAGHVTSGIAIIRNTTKDREVEEIKSDFISIVSHELRTPLTAIKGFLSMTLKNDFGPLSEKQYHYLSRVYQSNQRMIDLVEDLMDATYIESGKITLNIAPVALDSIVGNVVSELAAKGAAGHIMINVKRRQRLPLVLADETRLHQIVLNLVDNAIKYSMPNTEVQVTFQVKGDELITTVTDHGVGIGKSQIERLFTKFGRIFNPLSVQAGGTGLGLYIVKNLVESHDGRIWVTSQESKGSKFNFSLPIAKQLPLIE